MDIKNILANTAIVCLLAGCSGEHVLTNYKPTIDNAVKTCLPAEGTHVDFSKNPIVALRDLINWQSNSTSYDKDLFLQQAKLRLGDDEVTYNAIEMGLSIDINDEIKTIGRLRTLRADIDANLNKMVVMKRIDALRFKLHQASVGSNEEQELVTELTLQTDKLRGGGLDPSKKTLVRSIDMSNIEELEAGFDDAMEVYSNVGIMGYGLQGYNDLFGENQGIRRGETLVISALQHKWKSGALLSSAIQAAYFNKPTFIRLPEPKEGQEDKRKPLIMHITLENDVLGELLFTYKYIREQLEGNSISIANLDKEQKAFAVQYVKNFFESQGFHFVVRQHAAGEFDYAQLFSAVEKYEELGYEIHHITLDYMGKMSTRGCVEGPHGKNIQDLYQRIQNFMLRKKIAFVTAHQMSTEAKALERNGEEILVKAVCELGYYAGCRTVDNEVDMEIYQHKVIINGKHYITWQRGKHRSPGNITAEELKFCIYQMHPVAVIPWDVGREPMYTRKLPGYGNADVSADMF